MNDNYNVPKHQVEYLKSVGLQFVQISEKRAYYVLQKEFYYHKIMGYKYFFEQYKSSTKNDLENFNGIDFGDLYQLAKIDYTLCEVLNDMTIDVENFFKVFIVNYVDNNPKVDEFFYYNYIDIEKRFQVDKKIDRRIRDYNDVYSVKIKKKHPNLKPVWVLNEYLSFGETLEIFKVYVKSEKINKYNFELKMLNNTKVLRNHTAHGNKLFVNKNSKVAIDKDLIFNLQDKFSVKIKGEQIESFLTYNVISTLYMLKFLAPLEIYNEKCDRLFMALHRIAKKTDLYEVYKDEQFSKDLKNIYKIVNKMY